MQKKQKKPRNQIVVTACPCCGNDIEVSARAGEVRKCPYCRWRYIVSYEHRNRKVLEEYIKIPKANIAQKGELTWK